MNNQPGQATEGATLLIRVNSHRARDRMKHTLGDIGTNLFAGSFKPGEFYAVTETEFQKLFTHDGEKLLAGISQARMPKTGLSPAWCDDHERWQEARRRLAEYEQSQKPLLAGV